MIVTNQEKKRDLDTKLMVKSRYEIKKELLHALILQSGPTGLTRSQISAYMNIPWSTAYDWLTKLELEGQIVRFPLKIGIGRPKTYWIAKS